MQLSRKSFTIDTSGLMRRINDLPVWFWLVVIAAIPRLLNLGGESLWFDESFTWFVVQQKTDFWKAVLGDDHPPLWSILQWINVRTLGNSEFAFRLPALVFSVACVYLIWKIALIITNDRPTAFIAGLLTAILPSMIYFGQDARMYAFLAFSVLFLLRAVMTRRYICAFVAGLCAVYAQNTGLFYVVGIGTVVILYSTWESYRIFQSQKNRLRLIIAKGQQTIWFLVFGMIGLCYLPWLPTLLIQAKRVQASFWVPPMTPLNVFWPLFYDSFYGRVPDILQLHIFVAFTALVVVGLWLSRKWLRPLWTWRSSHYLAALLSGPALLIIYSLITGRNIYVHRPILASLMLLTIPCGYALCHLRLQYRQIARAVTFACIAVSISFYYTYNVRMDVPKWLQPIIHDPSQIDPAYLNQTATPFMPALQRYDWESGDAIWFTDGTPAVLFGRYLLDYPIFLRPYHGDIMSLTDPARDAFSAYLKPATLDDLKSMGYKRAWWIVIRNPFTEGQEITAINDVFARFKVAPVWIQQTSKTSWNFIYLVTL